MKKKLIIILALFTLTIIVVVSILYVTRLDVVVPGIKVKFTPYPNSKQEDIRYSYCYEGQDFINGRDGSYDCSGLLDAKTGMEIIIPEKRVISFWPHSEFTHLAVNAYTVTQDKFGNPSNMWLGDFYDKNYFNSHFTNHSDISDENYTYILQDKSNGVTELRSLP